MRKRWLIGWMGFLLTSVTAHAQVDPHFTQYYAYPQWLNPAFTGLIDGNFRVSANYRSQLPGLYAPMQTQAISAEWVLPRNFSIGATAFKQSSGDAGYQYINSYFSLGYQIHLTNDQVLSSGFQIGVLNRKIDPGKLQFGTQYNPAIGYDPSLPANEVLLYQSATSLDGSLGILYFDGNPHKKWNPYLGVSIYHPNAPANRFLSGADSSKIPIRYSFQGGIRFAAGNRMTLIPHMLYQQQGSADELVAGLVCNYLLETGKELIVGGTYRLGDAIAPTIGIHLNGLTIGFSYDINTSQLKTASSSNGGYELSISFTGQKKLPDTRFICPRL